MSDLKDQGPDQAAPPTSRIGAANRLRPDRGGRVSDQVWGLLGAFSVLALGCVSTPPPLLEAPRVPRQEVWVDAYSAAGGDGTSAKPLKAVPDPIAPGTALHLRSGLYAGPFILGEGVTVEGHGEVVLTGEAGQTVVTATGATLQHVSVQGGALGLEAGPGVQLSDVRFSGQRKLAALVRGRLQVEKALFTASVEGIDGLSVERGATLELKDTKFEGGFRRAVLSEGGTLALTRVTAEGPRTLLHATGAASRLTQVSSTLGSGPALFFSGGTATFRGGEILGHEFGVQLTRGAQVELSELVVQRSAQACVSAVGSTLSVSKSTFTGCGSAGAFSLQTSKTQLRGVEIVGSREMGVFVKQGTLTLDDVKISKVSAGPDRSLGDALHVRDEAQVRGEGPVTVTDVDGSALFASSFSRVELSSLAVERAGNSALFIERHAEVTFGTLLVRGGAGPAIVVPDRASVQVKSLSVAGGNEMPVYAECSAGASVELGRLESTVQQLPSRCVLVK